MASDLEKFVTRAEKAEKEVEELAKELEAIEPLVQAAAAAKKNKTLGDGEEEVPEELAKLRAENAKLKYRLGILQRAIESELARGKGAMVRH